MGGFVYTPDQQYYFQNQKLTMVGEDKFCLKWDDFQFSISQSFQEFREDLVDVTIFCGKKKVEAHRLVLCACSAVFKELILKNTATNPSILLFDVELVELYNLLDFMYKGEVSVSQDRLQKFLDLAEKLEVKGLYQQGRPESEKPKPVNRQLSPPIYQNVSTENKIISKVSEIKVCEPIVRVIEDDNDVNIVAVKHEKPTEDVVTLAAPDYPMMDDIQNYEYESYDSTSASEDQGYLFAHSSYSRDDKVNSFGDYPCILCGKSYKTAGSLKNHRSLYHRDEITKNKCPNYTII